MFFWGCLMHQRIGRGFTLIGRMIPIAIGTIGIGTDKIKCKHF